MLQYLTADEADGKPKPDRQCNKKEEFDVVSKLEVNDHVLAYYYGVDAYDKDANCYVDIKTCKHVPEHDERKLRIFQRHKLLKWWAQCQLGAVSEVVGCYRDDSGIVTRLKRMPTREMPNSAREWSANVCYNFLDQFLTWVKQRIPAVDADTRVHVFEYVPQSKIVRYSQTRDEAKMFLPDWYVDSQ
ncbi:decapping and exoribonuclease protein-like [Dreissena polymorpha]|uniref:Decapping nuclease n=1 Tax=Dreissena polymorpha TaxID=45954 RepID=A0A9D3YS07_DREPO|nr:decapping and exoribonuclease protein-like [Dreissena polymorpha]KAH3703809.1 hypothetical protein DPMN_078856 [Dreissena polymorpha]